MADDITDHAETSGPHLSSFSVLFFTLLQWRQRARPVLFLAQIYAISTYIYIYIYI